jgi:hypothetical protein
MSDHDSLSAFLWTLRRIAYRSEDLAATSALFEAARRIEQVAIALEPTGFGHDAVRAALLGLAPARSSLAEDAAA